MRNTIPTYSVISSVTDDIYHMMAEAEAQIDFNCLFFYKNFLLSLFITNIGEPMVEVIDKKSDEILQLFDLSSFNDEVNDVTVKEIIKFIS